MDIVFNNKAKRKAALVFYVGFAVFFLIGIGIMIPSIISGNSDNVFGGAMFLFLSLACLAAAIFVTLYNRDAMLEIHGTRISGRFGLNKKIDKSFEEIKDVFINGTGLLFLFKDGEVASVAFVQNAFNIIHELKSQIYEYKAKFGEKPDMPTRAESLLKKAVGERRVWLILTVIVSVLIFASIFIVLKITDFKDMVDFTEEDKRAWTIFIITLITLVILFSVVFTVFMAKKPLVEANRQNVVTSLIFSTPLQNVKAEKVVFSFPFWVRLTFYKDENGETAYFWEHVNWAKGKYSLVCVKPEKEDSPSDGFFDDENIYDECSVEELEKNGAGIDITQFFVK